MISLEDDFSLSFEFEKHLELAGKNDAKEMCKYYLKGHCSKGSSCPFRHLKPEKAVVCKHWLRGLCKKGDRCEFLHEYDPKRMPECWFYAKYLECTNPECFFLHINPDDKIKNCPWYHRGFCKHGPKCRYKHNLALACPSYLAGFCLKGPTCKFIHPSFEIPKEEDYQMRQVTIIQPITIKPQAPREQKPQEPRSLESVLCFKCGQKGHYANKCPSRRSMMGTDDGY
jgi:cleavage and polyadenylation specificity factor subunit 4